MALEQFKQIKFTQRTASAGTQFKPYYEAIPKKLRIGKDSKAQKGFFSYDEVKKKPEKYHVEVDPSTNEKALYVEKEELKAQYLEFILRTGSLQLISSSYTSSFSASFFADSGLGGAFGSMPDGEFIGILSEHEPSNPTASAVVTRYPGVENPGYLVINNTSEDYTYAHYRFSGAELLPNAINPNTRQQKITNNLTGSTPHLTRSFVPTLYLHGQDEPTPEWSVKFISPGPDSQYASAWAENVIGFCTTSSISTSADYGLLASGSPEAIAYTDVIGFQETTWLHERGEIVYYDGSGTDAHSYYYLSEFKGTVSGEGFNGHSSPTGISPGDRAYLPIISFIHYSSSMESGSGDGHQFKVGSGSFNFSTSSAVHAKTSGVSTQLFYSLENSIPHTYGASGSYTGSFIGNPSHRPSGSHIFTDAKLTTPASTGFYHLPGTTTVLGAFHYWDGFGNNDFSHPSASYSIDNVPVGKVFHGATRWTSKSIHA
tara:strand:+ start:2514 stop:3971 length:1458 start_codon:yes stop_codon:yes gene_type:complete